MEYGEFIDRVQERAGLTSRAAAERITRATLGTLGERLYRTAREDLAAMLPAELKEYMGSQVDPQTTRSDVDRFRVENFYLRVAGRADINRTEAVDQAQAVMSVLREAVTPAKWEDIRSDLPAGYEELFG